MKGSVVTQRDQLADAARDSDWSTVLTILATHPDWTNTTRIGGTSGYTSLHQAAWHGTDPGVVISLLDLGAWRTIRTADGQRAADIAEQRGHGHLKGLLRPVIQHPVPTGTLEQLQRRLHALIHERAGNLVAEHRLRLPELEPLTELATPTCWFPVPGMYGGFNYQLAGTELTVRSWCRVVGGSGQTHRISADATELTESGWA